MARVDVSQYQSFGQINDRLDELVSQVRDKDVSLERSLDLFDEAIALGSKAVSLVDATDFSPEEEARLADEPAPEGEVMRAWLIAHGARAEDIVAETKSFNTRENLIFAREIMQAQGLSRVVIVTSDYHVARALALCGQVGIEATGAGSESKPEYWLKNHVRETLSWAKFIVESVLWKIGA